MTPSTVAIAAVTPLIGWVIYAAIIEAFRLGVAYAHHCLERFEERPIDLKGLRDDLHSPPL